MKDNVDLPLDVDTYVDAFENGPPVEQSGHILIKCEMKHTNIMYFKQISKNMVCW